MFVASTISLNASHLIAGVMILRWVGPEVLGLWIQAQIIRIWLDVLRFGIPNGMNRELPSLLGEGRLVEARAVASTALFATVGTAVFGGCIFLLLTAKAVLQTESNYALALGSAGISWVATCYAGYLRGTYRSDSHFINLSIVQYSEAALALLSLALVSEWGFVGLCWRGALIAAAPALLLHRKRPFPVPLAFSKAALLKVWSSGIPQFINSYLINFAGTAERAVLLALPLGSSLAGYYAPALAVTSAMSTIPGSVTSYIYPKALHHFSKTACSKSVLRASASAMAVSAVCLLPICIAIFSFGPWIIEEHFPAYKAGVVAMQIAAWAGLLHAARTATIALIAFKAWREYTAYAGILAVCSWCFAYVGAKYEDPLIGTASGGLAASLVGGCFLLWSTNRITSRREVPRTAISMQ